MNRPFTIGNGDAKLVLNELPSQGGLTVEVRGVACTVLLSREHLIAAAAAFNQAAKRLPK